MDDDTKIRDAALDNDGVDAFAAAMKAKLKACREAGKYGWDTDSVTDLWSLLRDCVEKGDPVDVGNYAMMIHHVTHQTGEKSAV
jgi:hypothetical protein